MGCTFHQGAHEVIGLFLVGRIRTVREKELYGRSASKENLQNPSMERVARNKYEVDPLTVPEPGAQNSFKVLLTFMVFLIILRSYNLGD